MKKMVLWMIFTFLLPINVVAYSNYIIPGGETLGIEVKSDGVMIIGFYQINGKYNKGNPSLKAGDYIVSINGKTIESVKELTKNIENNINENILLTIRRNGILKNVKLDLIQDNGLYKTGLYVKDSITGIGTLSYIDPETRIFGALGHEVIESNTSSLIEIREGSIFRNYITGIEKSIRGYAGSKNAKFYYSDKYGKINKNTSTGIFGKYNSNIDNSNLLEIGDAHIGKAEIKTVLTGEEINNYTINITSINDNNQNKNISFTITDEKLLKKTGGIIQGMSGSPIIQDNKIVGVVTHVVIDNPENGYGIHIKTMLEEGEK